MLRFSDLLYGRIELPPWLAPFLRIPEFVRLRGIRLSNVDSIDFKDFGSANRWEHGIAVAYLAWKCGEYRGLKANQQAQLTLAGLLHDIATPPFAHTAEYVLENFDHERETERVLGGIATESFGPDTPVFASSLPQFQRAIKTLAREEGIKVDADEVAQMVVGDGELGFLISGTMDLDNIDNVTRGCAHMGFDIDKQLPLRLAQWLATQESAPIGLESVDNPSVQTWLGYRGRYYSSFFDSSEQELGRQAFLQHLMRRALHAGLPRRALVWNTDSGLLNTISEMDEAQHNGNASLKELVDRYKLLEPTHRVLEVLIEDEEALRVLRRPSTVAWVERRLSSPALELFVMVSSRRFGGRDIDSMLHRPILGALSAFKLGEELHHRSLPEWIKPKIAEHLSGHKLKRALNEVVQNEIEVWLNHKPWLALTKKRRDNLVEGLKSIGDWSFRLSRNENIHAYPSTFVHAIPASLINSLGLHGELILDPFGGTGQTAIEAIKCECSAISADSNTIATLIARARLTYLNPDARLWLRQLRKTDFNTVQNAPVPEFAERKKWHHPVTLKELSAIRNFIYAVPQTETRDFLLACFSAIIPLCTARKGKEHGFFADNTPLPAELTQPPYVSAIDIFLGKMERNLDIVARLYAFIERSGRDPERELQRATVLQVDARCASPEHYGLTRGSVAAIITSPPYLCMADYSLGQRLSYYWIAPESLKGDFEKEIGPRRHRFRHELAAENYFKDIQRFASNAATLIRQGGFLATILGRPVAQRFASLSVFEKIDSIFNEMGFEKLWEQTRPINWHRNQGYQRLLTERVAVHVRR